MTFANLPENCQNIIYKICFDDVLDEMMQSPLVGVGKWIDPSDTLKNWVIFDNAVGAIQQPLRDTNMAESFQKNYHDFDDLIEDCNNLYNCRNCSSCTFKNFPCGECNQFFFENKLPQGLWNTNWDMVSEL